MRIRFLILAFHIALLAGCGASAVESPPWWKQTRSIYASFDADN